MAFTKKVGDVEDLYDLFKLPLEATQKQIKKAYRLLALKFHPDKHPEEKKEWAEAMFDRLGKAKDVLTDEKLKKEYDAKLKVAKDRELKWAAANAEVKRMKEQLEKREQQAEMQRRAKRQKTAADETRRRNQEIMRQMQEEIEAEELQKDITRIQGNANSRKDQGCVKLKWDKGDKHSEETLLGLLASYGTISKVSMVGGRSAIVTFQRKEEAEDCFLEETRKRKQKKSSFRVKLVREDSIQESEDVGISKGDSISKNPVASAGVGVGKSSNPYANLFKTESKNNQIDKNSDQNDGVDLDSLENDILAQMMGE
eukprot:jgi/Bigna1/53792/estExt_Genewise1Plus.C_240087